MPSRKDSGKHFRDAKAHKQARHSSRQEQRQKRNSRRQQQQYADDREDFDDSGKTKDENLDGLDVMASYVDSESTHEGDDPYDLMPDLSMDAYEQTEKDEERVWEHERQNHPHHRVRNTFLVILIVFVVVLGGFTAVFYVSARNVYNSSLNAVSLSKDIATSFGEGNTKNIVSDAQSFSQCLQSMKDETDKPIWKIAQHVPFISGDVQKAIDLVDIGQQVSVNVVTPVAQDMDGVSVQSILSNQKIDLDSLNQLCKVFSDVQPAIADADQQINALGGAQFEYLNDPLQASKARLNELNTAAVNLGNIAPQLPAMLGSEGTRTYLVVAQNNAQLRSTGGSPAAQMLISINQGKFTLSTFKIADEDYQEGQIPLTDEERQIVVDLMGTDADTEQQDVNVVPSFPRAAQLLEWCSEKNTGESVDGVIAIDPIFLQDLLDLIGGVRASNGTQIDGENAAQLMMNGVYLNQSSESKHGNSDFAQLAGLSLSSVVNNMGRVSITDFVRCVWDATQTNHFTIYMDKEDEEAAIERINAAGEVNQDGTQPVAALYLNDACDSKLDWYLKAQQRITGVQYNDDSSVTYTVDATLENTAAATAMQNNAPEELVGDNPEGRNYGIVLSCLIMAPTGGSISDVDARLTTDKDQSNVSLYGNNVVTGSLEIDPGETIDVSYKITTQRGATAPLQLYMTPVAQS